MHYSIEIPSKAFDTYQKSPGISSLIAAGFSNQKSRMYNYILTTGEAIHSDQPGTGNKLDKEVSDKGLTITTRSANITDLDSALKFANVDLNQYEVERFIVNSWEVTMGGDKSGTKKPETFTNYQVKVWLKPKAPVSIGMESFFKKVWEKPLAPIKRKRLTRKSKLMAEIALYDHHFGMLAWREEVIDDYDNKIARQLYDRAVNYLLDDIGNKEIEQFLLPIGHDLFHFNDDKAETPTSKHKLEVDGRLVKVFEIVEEALIRAIKLCAKIAPVHAYWIPGNHDPELSFAMCRSLKNYFRLSQQIHFDVSANHRKYHQYGKTLIGMTHGVREQPAELLGRMLEEKPIETGEALCREIHRGHTHKEKSLELMIDSKSALTIRTLPSLAAQDKNAHFNGYSKSGRAAKALFFDKETGYAGEKTAPVIALS